MLIFENPWRLLDWMYSTPSADATARSSGVVMKPRTSSALAPTYTVLIVTAAFSLRGYWRTESERHDWMPAMTIRKLTTSATTGFWMKRSVKEDFFMGV